MIMICIQIQVINGVQEDIFVGEFELWASRLQ